MKLYIAVQSRNNLKLLWVLPKSEKFPKRRDFVIGDAPNAKQKVQGGFFNWSALKMTKSQTLRKF